MGSRPGRKTSSKRCPNTTIDHGAPDAAAPKAAGRMMPWSPVFRLQGLLSAPTGGVAQGRGNLWHRKHV